MHSLLYFSYGHGLHIEETIFSIYSARYWEPDQQKLPIIVYTDSPDRFSDLKVEIRFVDQSTLDAWMNGESYIHRRKTMCLISALEQHEGGLIFIDGDTWFKNNPTKLFSRIDRGFHLLHLLESKLVYSGDAANLELDRVLTEGSFCDLNGNKIEFSSNTTMWNSGVIGLTHRSLPKVREGLHFMDQLWDITKSVNTVEQYAMGHFLAADPIKECGDIVCHYWFKPVRNRFRKQLPGLLEQSARMPLEKRASWLFRQRPKPSIKANLRCAVKGAMHSFGLPVPGVRMSM